MTTTEPNLAQALAAAGTDDLLRSALFDSLRAAERRAADPRSFRDKVRAPLISALLQQVGTHTVELSTGLKFEVSTASRIEMALLLSSEDRPNHVWEPQTTKLLTTLARGCRNVIVGGAYIGDHVIPMAQIAERVHAFEPMKQAHERLLRNIQLNAANNVRPHRIGLWDKSGELLKLDGDMALASSETSPNGDVESLTIDDYTQREQLGSVGLIMLDTEGGEEKALIGAAHVLATHSPHVVFEIHRSFVDWSNGLENTTVLRRRARLPRQHPDARSAGGSHSRRNRLSGRPPARLQHAGDKGCVTHRTLRDQGRERSQSQAAARSRPGSVCAVELTESKRRWNATKPHRACPGGIRFLHDSSRSLPRSY